MKKTFIAFAIALTTALSSASPVEEIKDTNQIQEKVFNKVEKAKRIPLTAEQFNEKKTTHLNKLNNRQKILKGEINCTESAKNMGDIKVCFRSAMYSRKELGTHRSNHILKFGSSR